MFLKSKILLIFISLCMTLSAEKAKAGKTVQVYPKSKDQLPYLLYLPKGYRSSKTYPVLLFLHGIGERGHDLNKLYKTGLPKNIKSGKHYPFIIIMPQCPNDGHYSKKGTKQFWWNKDPIVKVKNIIDEEVKNLSIDSSRIYVTGLSMGGFGTYKIINEYPDFFAAAAPICGHDFGKINASKLKHMPIWAFHGDKDKVVPLKLQQNTVNRLKKADVDVKFTIYSGVAHDSWTQTYANPELFKWLLSKKK